MMKKYYSLLFFLSLFQMSFAQWKTNDTTPILVSAAASFQYAVLYSIDDDGNSFYVWADYRNDNIDLYAQKLDAKGTPQWTKDGLRIGRILDKSTFIYTPKLIKPDGKGGAYIAWHRLIDVNKVERRNLYAQYVSSDGKAQWIADGMKVTDQELTSYDPNDGVMELNDLKNDKLLFTFNNYSSSSTANIVYTKKLNYAGATIEAETKLLEGKGLETKVLYDEKNSKFIALIKDAATDYLYQTFDASNKSMISAAAFYSNPFSGTSRVDLFKIDNNGNAVVGRTLSGDGKKIVVAHKVDKTGKSIWRSNGTNLGSNATFDVQIVPTSDGGGIATWLETGDKSKPFQVAKLNAKGDIIWKNDVFTPKSDKSYFLPNKLISDGKEGVYTLWLKPKNIGYDLTIQRIDANGTLKFGDDGFAFKDFTFFSDYRLMLHPKTGVIILYGANKELEDGRGGSVDLYTNYLTETGKLGFEAPPVITVVPNANNTYCAGQAFTVSLTTSGGSFNLDNNFRILLSDKNGSFDKIIEIGKDVRKSVNVITMQDLENGNYKIKVVSTSPVVESSNVIEIKIEETEAPTITADKLLVCAGGTDNIIFSSKNCQDGILKWSNAAIGTSIMTVVSETTTYTAVCSIVGCKESAVSNSIAIQANKILATVSNTGPYFEGEVMKLSSAGGTKYEWSGPNSFASTIQNPTVLNVPITASGTYFVKITDDANCSATAQTVVLVNVILANETPSEMGIKVFPNPVSQQLIISFDAEANKDVNISLLDIKGRVIEQRKIKSQGGFQQEKIDIQPFTSGQYLIKINTSTQESVKKLVIEK
jgi:Secretion system C-terminal sorting domain